MEAALAEGRREDVAACLSDRWLADTTLFGSANKVRDGIEAWFDAGIRAPIIVPSSASGGQIPGPGGVLFHLVAGGLCASG